MSVAFEQYRHFFNYLVLNPTLVVKEVFPEEWVQNFIDEGGDVEDEDDGVDITGEILMELLQEQVDEEATEADEAADPLEGNDFDALIPDDDD